MFIKMRKVIKEWWKIYFICVQCWLKKEAISDNFWKSKYWYMWLKSECKDCAKKRTQEYRIKNHDKYKESNKIYYSKNKEKIQNRARKWEEEHKEEYKKYKENYREKNKDRRNEYNRAYIKEYQKRDYVKANIKEHAIEMWYKPIHRKTNYLIKKLWIRPSVCPLCWKSWKIISHHPDYNKWNEIVFCCISCHAYIHNWKIKDFKTVKLSA